MLSRGAPTSSQSERAVVPAVTRSGGVSGRGRPRTLYVSYDGILEPLGESQVLGYLERLAGSYAMTLMTFEKARDLLDEDRVRAVRRRLGTRGIRWICLRYHRRPPIVSTALDIARGIWSGWQALHGGAQLIHARGYVPGLIALVLARLSKAAFLFDMRGFWADEKVDGGHWSSASRIYGVTKYFERRFFESAQAIVSLTYEGVKAFPALGYRIPAGTPIEVIPTCTDLDRFRPGPKDDRMMARLGLTGHRVIGVSGTISNWYLRQPMLECLAYLVKTLDRTKLLIVTRDDHDRLRADARAAGVPDGSMTVTSAEYERMPEFLRLMDVGLFFIKVCFSKKGSCATKLGEFLATGVPVVINEGIGDSDRIVRDHATGVVLPEATVAAMRQHLPALLELFADSATQARCRTVARAELDVVEGSRKYGRLYERVLQAQSVSRNAAEVEAR